MRYLSILIFSLSLMAHTPVCVVGDSHVKAFEGILCCRRVYLGPVTMHRVGRDGFNPQELRSQGLIHGVPLLYVFGEIDVRCHIGKQRDFYHRDETEILLTLATNYLEAIAANQLHFNSPLAIVYNIVPPTDVTYNEEYPRYGDLEDRVRIARKLNELLRSLCPQYGFQFLEIYGHYADEKGALRFDLSDGNVHIHPTHNLFLKTRFYQILATSMSRGAYPASK